MGMSVFRLDHQTPSLGAQEAHFELLKSAMVADAMARGETLTHQLTLGVCSGSRIPLWCRSGLYRSTRARMLCLMTRARAIPIARRLLRLLDLDDVHEALGMSHLLPPESILCTARPMLPPAHNRPLPHRTGKAKGRRDMRRRASTHVPRNAQILSPNHSSRPTATSHTHTHNSQEIAGSGPKLAPVSSAMETAGKRTWPGYAGGEPIEASAETAPPHSLRHIPPRRHQCLAWRLAPCSFHQLAPAAPVLPRARRGAAECNQPTSLACSTSLWRTMVSTS